MILGSGCKAAMERVSLAAHGAPEAKAETAIVADVVVDPAGLVVNSPLQKNRSVAVT
jgi:hypothetical protein